MTELRWAMGIGTAAVLILGLMVFWYVYRLKGSGKNIIYLAVSIMWLAWGSYVAVVFILIERNTKSESTPEVITEIGMADFENEEFLAGGNKGPSLKKRQRRKMRRTKRIQRKYGLVLRNDQDKKEMNYA
ncbi:hypothetical protein [uncultured Algoriphagus sp.]|uniref:hypothetical protein n=1 Tax=uncultured Algoriphagus sp. TaxID=417365 RepID=UPI002586D20A|nr:hypothetical protein [uncultured Algoriphagus sp.]